MSEVVFTMKTIGPLGRYANDPAVAPVMREIAFIALAKGFNQQQLANKLGYTAPAIIKHFGGSRQSRETIALYASALDVSEEYLGLVMTPRKPLATARLKYWFRALKKKLEKYESERVYTRGTASEAMRAFSKVSSVELTSVIELYALSEYRSRQFPYSRPRRHEYGSSGYFEGFADATVGYFNLNARLRKRVPDEGFLGGLWLWAVPKLAPQNTDTLIDVAETLLRRQGTTDNELAAMRNDLEATKAEFGSDERRKNP